MTKEEIQNRLEEISLKRSELCKEEVELNKKFDSLNKKRIDFKVGDFVIASNGDVGNVVSINGPEGCPIIAIIHRHDTGVDNAQMFDWYGLSLGYSRKYTISK